MLETGEPAPTRLAALVGVEVHAAGDGQARGGVEVRDELTAPDGALDGGVYVTLAESVCLAATARATGATASCLAQQMSILHRTGAGRLAVEGRATHRGRTTWVWEVDFSDALGRLCAVGRLTVVVAPGPAAPLEAQPR